MADTTTTPPVSPLINTFNAGGGKPLTTDQIINTPGVTKIVPQDINGAAPAVDPKNPNAAAPEPGSTGYTRIAPTASTTTSSSGGPAATTQATQQTPEQAAGDYRTSALSNAQDQIKNIGDVYDKELQSELAAEKPAEQNSLGRTNALSALMGLSGSSSADTRTAVTEKKNADIETGISSKINAQKLTALNAIYGQIDAGAQKVYEAQLETNKQNQKNLLDEQSKNALGTITSLATTLAPEGKTFDDFKNADNGDALNKLMTQTGMSEYQLRAAWSNALPENLKPIVTTTYHDDGKGGTTMQTVTVDPVTHKSSVQSYPLSVPVSTFNGDVKPIEGKNGELFVKQADGSYKDVSPNAENNKATQAANTNKTNSDAAKTAADAAKIRADIAAGSPPTTYTKNQETDGLNWLRRQPGYTSADDDRFKNDPVAKAWAIKKATDEKKAKTSTATNPFAAPTSLGASSLS